MKIFTLRNLAYITAVALVATSGTVSVVGLAKFAPGSVAIVIVLGALFELYKLAAFTLIGRKGLSRPVKVALGVFGSVLVVINIVGVSGQLSSTYTQRLLAGQATSHTAEATARADAGIVERQLAAAESNLQAARNALIRAKDDRGRVKAAQAVVTTATAERDALARQLSVAQATTAKVEGDKIGAAGEFAAVAYIASLTGYSMDRVAQLFILAISCLPDLLAITLLIAAGHSASHGGAREGAGRPRNQANLKSKPVRKAKLRRTGKPANLKVVNAQP
jgi:hypothetical protein